MSLNYIYIKILCVSLTGDIGDFIMIRGGITYDVAGDCKNAGLSAKTAAALAERNTVRNEYPDIWQDKML